MGEREGRRERKRYREGGRTRESTNYDGVN